MPLRECRLAMSFPTKFDVMGIRYMTAPEGGGLTPTATPAAPTPTPPAGDTLGDGGQKALQAERNARAEAEKTAKAYSALGSVEDLQKLLQANQDKGVEKIREQAKTEAEAAANERLHNKLRSNVLITQAAVLGFNKPEDATAFLTTEQISGLAVSDSDEVDAAAAKALLDGLVKERPYLVKNATPDHRAAGIGSVSSAPNSSSVGPGRPRLAHAYNNPKQ